MFFIAMAAIGVLVGVFGTLVGAGGGFILIPILIMMNPRAEPEYLTAISLAVIFFNALSGTIAYARMKRIHYRAGITFALASIPGAVLGALTVHYVPRQAFDIILGIFMLVSSVYLFITPEKESCAEKGNVSQDISAEESGAKDTTPSFPFNAPVGIGLSIVIGYISSLLGIGGGIIHVPVLIHILNFPVHVSTATSHFILAIMTLAGTITHIASGSLHHGLDMLIPLSVGVTIGAQIGAYLSRRLSARWIVRSLALALGFVAVRLLLIAILVK